MRVELEILPVEEESDDVTTWATVDQVRSALKQDAASLSEYTLVSNPSGGRGLAELALIGAWVATNRELLTSCFNVLAAALELLAKRHYIQEITIIADGKTLILKDVKQKTAQELIEAFEQYHPGITTTLGPHSQFSMRGTVSKRRHKN